MALARYHSMNAKGSMDYLCGQFVDRIYSIRLLRDGSGCEGMQKP